VECTGRIGDMRSAVLVAAAALAACGPPERVEAPDMRIEVGRPFPQVLLPMLEDGSPATLARFRGRKTLLHVFASW